MFFAESQLDRFLDRREAKTKSGSFLSKVVVRLKTPPSSSGMYHFFFDAAPYEQIKELGTALHILEAKDTGASKWVAF